MTKTNSKWQEVTQREYLGVINGKKLHFALAPLNAIGRCKRFCYNVLHLHLNTVVFAWHGKCYNKVFKQGKVPLKCYNLS